MIFTSTSHTRLERVPEEHGKELWIALAGPAVNVAIATVLYGSPALTHAWEPLSRLRVASGPLIERLLLANISLVLFNLVPAFPMDGGRVLRAPLARRMTYAKATETAAFVGQGFALVFGFIGPFTNPMLLVIGVFIWFTARQEAATAPIRSTLSALSARAAMITDFEVLRPGDTLSDAGRLTLKGSQRDFPVVEHGRVTGILTRSDPLEGLADYGQDCPVRFLIHSGFPVAEPAEQLETALQRLQESGAGTMPVVQEGRLIGLISSHNLGERLLIGAVLRNEGRSITP
jgi:CBS domain-containing protein